jgi:hypothetical protein
MIVELPGCPAIQVAWDQSPIGSKIQNTIEKLSSQNTAAAPSNLTSGRLVVVRIELEVKGLVVLVT